jgi:hypothetical protein
MVDRPGADRVTLAEVLDANGDAGHVTYSAPLINCARCFLLFPVSAVVVWCDSEQTNELAVAECRCPA